MTIASEINTLISTKNSIKSAIIAKGISVSDSDSFASYATKIGQISTGQTINNQLKVITSNGEYEPDEGYTGIGTANVQVPSLAKIHSNGAYVTISNAGVASGFDSNNYIQYPFWVASAPSWTFVICCKASATSYTSAFCGLFNPPSYQNAGNKFCLYTDNGRLGFGYDSSGYWNDIDCNFDFTVNQETFVKLVYTQIDKTIDVYTSTDGETYTYQNQAVSYDNFTGILNIGINGAGSSEVWAGSVDLSKSYLQIGNDKFSLNTF